MRLACIFVPQLALQSVLRRSPDARGEAAVLMGLPSPSVGKAAGKVKERVLELTSEARRAGVVPRMTAAQASAVCPGVRLLSATPADIEAAAGALADVGYAFAPRVEREPERVFFETDDLGRLYPLGEAAITQAVQAQALRVGLQTRVAIAASKGVARVATRARELAVVPVGGARSFLAPMPIEQITGDQTLRDAFRRWGTQTAGQIAALPTDAVALRLGESGARVSRLARGEDDEPFFPQLPTDALEEAIDLDYGIAELEPLTFVLRGLIDRALARLGGRSLACAGLTVRLTLEPRGVDVRTVPIAAPTRDTATLLQLIRLDLARRPPDKAIVGIRLVALPARVRSTQLDILRASGPAPDRLAATIARLAALVGPENVGAPASVDTWREDAVAVAPFALLFSPQPSPPTTKSQTDQRPALTIRRLRPPQEIEVLVNRREPTALRGRDTTARVLVAAGPYTASGEWWRTPEEDGAWAHEYWNVHASDGAVYRIHKNQHDGRWFLDGYYD